MELRLSEELFVLALNEKGIIAPFKREYLKYGIAAAILQELLILKKLQLDDESVDILDCEPFGDKLLDTAFEILDQSEKKKKVQHWVSKLGSKYGKFKKVLLDDLIDKGVLKTKDESGGREAKPGLFHRQRYKVWDDIPLQYLRKRLYDMLVHGLEPDPKSLRLIGLIHACKLTRMVFSHREDHEKVMLRIDTLTTGDIFKKSIRNIIITNRISAFSGLISTAVMIAKEAC